MIHPPASLPIASSLSNAECVKRHSMYNTGEKSFVAHMKHYSSLQGSASFCILLFVASMQLEASGVCSAVGGFTNRICPSNGMIKKLKAKIPSMLKWPHDVHGSKHDIIKHVCVSRRPLPPREEISLSLSIAARSLPPRCTPSS